MIEDLMRKFSKTNKFLDKELIYKFYEQVSKEIQSGIKEDGVWAKAYAMSSGDEQKAKAQYIELMVERLMLANDAKTESESKKEKQEKIKNKIHQKKLEELKQEQENLEWNQFMDSKGGENVVYFIIIGAALLSYFIMTSTNLPDRWYTGLISFVLLMFLSIPVTYIVFEVFRKK
jgi:hypothetical protein